MAEVPAVTVGGSQDQHLLVREAGIAGLATMPARLSARPRSPLRLSRTKASPPSAIAASWSGASSDAARKRRHQRCAVLGAIPQRAADGLIVFPSASEAPKDSHRSLWCSPQSAAPVGAPNVFPRSLRPKRRRPHALLRRHCNADSAACYPRAARSLPARLRPRCVLQYRPDVLALHHR